MTFLSLQWHHNDHDSVSNHQPQGCLLNCLFGHRSKKTSKLRVTGLCAGNSPGEFFAQMASDVENVSIWWRHHVYPWKGILIPGKMVLILKWGPGLTVGWLISVRHRISLSYWNACRGVASMTNDATCRRHSFRWEGEGTRLSLCYLFWVSSHKGFLSLIEAVIKVVWVYFLHS